MLWHMWHYSTFSIQYIYIYIYVCCMMFVYIEIALDGMLVSFLGSQAIRCIQHSYASLNRYTSSMQLFARGLFHSITFTIELNILI